MRIGVDFDNTLVCYDDLFARVCRERGLIGDDFPANKTAIRDHLRAVGREDDWTEVQGIVYGPRITEATAFGGALDFLRQAGREGHEIFIISHKTRHPYRGEKHDLHEAALNWLRGNGAFDPDGGGVKPERALFHERKEEKIARIAEVGCDWFIDDLPEILGHERFPEDVQRVLFDPGDAHGNDERWYRVNRWREIGDLLQREAR
jgi:hypothetical protein